MNLFKPTSDTIMLTTQIDNSVPQHTKHYLKATKVQNQNDFILPNSILLGRIHI